MINTAKVIVPVRREREAGKQAFVGQAVNAKKNVSKKHEFYRSAGR